MDTYSLLREFADSWALLALFAVFAAVVVWAWRPGSRAVHDDAAQVPFRNDAAAPTPRAPRTAGCGEARGAGACAVPESPEEPRHG